MKITDIITEAANPAQQAAIAVAMKKAGKKPKQGVAEGGTKDRQWSNKDMERLRVATRDFDDIMASDGPDQTKHDLIKKRIQTKPLAGPKGVLPEEQGVAEESKGLWANIHAKRDRIKQGSGEHMRKPGSTGAPTKAALRKATK